MEGKKAKISVYALLGNSLDYAGYYPPARQTPSECLERLAQFQSEGKNPFLFSKWVLPLKEALSIRSEMVSPVLRPQRLSLIAISQASANAQTFREWESVVASEEREVQSWNARMGGNSFPLTIAALETVVPGPILAQGSTGDMFSRWFVHHTYSRIPMSLELDLRPGPQQGTEVILSRLASLLLKQPEKPPQEDQNERTLGLKVRLSGQEPIALSDLTTVIGFCAEHKLRFKATQGLHASMSHGADIGFINLLACLAFTFTLGPSTFSSRERQSCLAEPRKDGFVFGSRSLRWGTYEVDATQIEQARRIHHASFGSCSLDEPDTSLTDFLGS